MGVAGRIATKLVLTHGKQKWSIQPARIRMWITFTGQGASYAPQVDTTGVPAVLKRFAPDLHRAPTEARFLRVRSGGVFGVTASRLGRALDPKATASRVAAALAARLEGTAEDKPVKVQLDTFDKHDVSVGIVDRTGSIVMPPWRYTGPLSGVWTKTSS